MPLNHPLTCPEIDRVINSLMSEIRYEVDKQFDEIRAINAELRTAAEIQIEELEKENEELKSEIEQLQTEVGGLEDETGKLQDEIERLQGDVYDLEVQLSLLERDTV